MGTSFDAMGFRVTDPTGKVLLDIDDDGNVVQKGDREGGKPKTTQHLELRMQALAQVNPLELVSAADLAALRRRDPHPFLQVFSICHEGTSAPTILGEGAKPITWLRKAVQSIKAAALRGIKFFKGHNADNSTEGREALGEVVASQEREIDGKLHHVVVGYFPDKKQVEGLDVCSQEADWDLEETPGGYLAGALQRLTGIALASSKTDRPAFPGAVRLGLVQAFEPGGTGKEKHMADLTSCTFQELLGELQRRQVFPSQAFTRDQLKADRNFAPDIERADKYDAVAKELADVKAGRQADAEKLKQAERVNAQAAAPGRLEKLAKDRNLTEKQAAFVQRKLAKRVDKLADLTDQGLGDFLTDVLEDFTDDAQGGSAQAGGKPGTGGASQGAGTTAITPDGSDLTKAANNPLLKADTAQE